MPELIPEAIIGIGELIGGGAEAIGAGIGAGAEAIGGAVGGIGDAIGAGVGAGTDALGAGAGIDSALAGATAGDTALATTGLSESALAAGGTTDAALGVGGATVPEATAAANSALGLGGSELATTGGAGFGGIGAGAPEIAQAAPVLGSPEELAPLTSAQMAGSDTGLMGLGATTDATAAPNISGIMEATDATGGQFGLMPTEAPTGMIGDINTMQNVDLLNQESAVGFDPLSSGEQVVPNPETSGGGTLSDSSTFAGQGGPTSPTTATATSAAGSGGGSWIDSALKYGKLAGAGLGLAGIAQAALGDKMPKQSKELEGFGFEQGKAAKRDLALAQADQVTPEQQAAIDQFKQQGYARAFQLAQQAGGGQGDPTQSSFYQQMKAQIDQQAQIMHEQFVQQLFQNAINLYGGASKDIAQVGQWVINGDQNLTSAIGNAARAMGGSGVNLVNLGGGTKTS